MTPGEPTLPATWTHTDFQSTTATHSSPVSPSRTAPTDVDSPQEAAEAVTDARAAVAALVAAPDALKTLLDAGLPELLHAAAQWDPAANHATDHDRETAAVQLAQRLARFGEAVQLYYSPNRGNSRYEGYRLKKRSIAVPGRAHRAARQLL